MTEDRVSFHIGGDVRAERVSFVGRDQINCPASPELMWSTAASLRRSVERDVQLDRQQTRAARAELDEIQAGLEQNETQTHRVAAALKRLTELLKEAGALVSASAALLDPLRALAVWLGTLGAPVLALLT